MTASFSVYNRLSGRTALVTGAGLGICRASNLRLTQEGARLVLPISMPAT